MKTQISQKPIFISVINHKQTPNNQSIRIVGDWYSCIEPVFDHQVIDTAQLKIETFYETVLTLTKDRPSVCMYFCLHGKHETSEEHPDGQEFLLLNPEQKISDDDFTSFIASLPVPHLYLYFEVCHSGGLINTLICDTASMPLDHSLVMFTACSKDQKCWTIHKQTRNEHWCIGETSQWLIQHKLNPFITPDACYMALRQNLPHLQPKYIVLRN